LVAAAKVKVILTGSLDAKVITYPFFPGTEKDLLRAMIARITCDTVINVKGMLTAAEDGSVTETEEFVFPSYDALAKPSGWSHCTDYILPSTGRCSYLEMDPENEETAAAYKAQELMKTLEPALELLRDVKAKNWAVRQHKVTHSVISIKSVKWPGAVCVCNPAKKAFTNLYVGMGHARDVDNFHGFYPAAPPDIMDEPVDAPEVPEPVAKPAEEAPAEE